MNNSWIEQYWNAMANANFELAISLKNDHFPKSFFKYRGLTDCTIETIEQNYIWLAEIATLNDPFECSMQFDNDECLRKFYGSLQFQHRFQQLTGHKLTDKEIEILTTDEKPFLAYCDICTNRNIPFNQTPQEQLDKVQKRWAEIVGEANQNIRICSFSSNNSSLLLWSHYGAEHKGIAIEYDFLDAGQLRTFMQPILYRDKIHKIGIFEDYSVTQMIASSLIKSKDWEYEEEWRLTIFKQRGKFPQKLTVPNPSAIYLGTRFGLNESGLIDRLFSLAQQRKIPLYEMGKHPNEFKLIKMNRAS